MSITTSTQQWRPTGPGSVRSRTINGYFSRVSHPFMTAAGLPGARSAQFITAMRPGLNRSLTVMSPVPAETHVQPVHEWLDGQRVRGEWVGVGPHAPRPDDPASARIIYYLHGSGYLVCSPRTHRGLVGRLAKRTGWSAFSLDYRLGPEHPFPAAGDDTIRGYHWLLSQGFRPEQIVVAGDSAGGHLALDLLADNHRRGVGQPAGLVLFSPLYDPTFDLAVASQMRGVRDPLIDAFAGQRLLRLYTRGTAADHPRMRVQLHTEMSLPPTLIQVGALEVMGDDARATHHALRAAGADSSLQEWPGQGHVFQMFPLFSPDSRHALHEAAAFMRAVHDA
ncbi:alpha/beta hydrolase [Gordonia sp. NPDC003424]